MLLYIEQNWAVPEVPVDWVLGENKIIELDVLSHRKVQVNVSFSPSYFQHPSRAEIIYSTTFVAIGHMKNRHLFVPCGLQKDKSCQIFGVCRLLIVVNRTDCGTTVRMGCF